MTLLIVLVVAGVLLALVGTLGLAGLQRWGLVAMVPIFAGLIAIPLGVAATVMMVLVEWIDGVAVRSLYGAADFWSAVLIIAYAVAAAITALGFRKEWSKTKTS